MRFANDRTIFSTVLISGKIPLPLVMFKNYWLISTRLLPRALSIFSYILEAKHPAMPNVANPIISVGCFQKDHTLAYWNEQFFVNNVYSYIPIGCQSIN